jgi:hypothetical protein
MPDCQQICRREYEEYKRRYHEEQQLLEERSLTTPATPATPATRRTLPSWVVWGLIHLAAGLTLLEILNWAARPH